MQRVFLYIFILTAIVFVASSESFESHENMVSSTILSHTIYVKTQADFDSLNRDISAAIQHGYKIIKVKICNGVFHFYENHIIRKEEHYPQVSIIIEGEKNTFITSDGEIFKYGNTIDNSWQEMAYANGLIEVVNMEEKLCKIPYPNHLDSENGRFSKVQITEWYRAPVFDVKCIDDQGIYFIASDLQYITNSGRKEYNVNYDWIYRQKTPRFRLYKADNESSCNAARMICLKQSTYKEIVLRNLHFVSNKVGSPLITLDEVKTDVVSIESCSFEHIRGTVLSASNTDNIDFKNNVVRHTDGNELHFLRNCQNVKVTNCLFENNGQAISNTFCVRCNEASYYIADNVFRDFGYGAIGVGLWHGSKKKWVSQGIIERNEIYFTPDYFENYWKNMLMDSGAIYTWTQNDDVVIRYNYIHDYQGMDDNRGIFCDDGASNLKIYGNVILNIPNSYCIDSRKCSDQHQGFTNNSNNYMANNIVDGRCRFMGYGSEERHCSKGSNYVLQGDEPIANKYEYLESADEDVVVKKWEIINGQVKLPKDVKKCFRCAVKDRFIRKLIR